jgi:2-polyprenyl-6-methoxyphenol hydroxylase-like FAD-dependent oxidoreductase
MRVADQCDVVVIGAGPAGSTNGAAARLVGWTVVLPHRATAASPAESLPASTRNPTTTASRRRMRSRPRSQSRGG